MLISAWLEVSKSKSPWPVKVDPPKVPERKKKQRKEGLKMNGKSPDVGGHRFKVFQCEIYQSQQSHQFSKTCSFYVNLFFPIRLHIKSLINWTSVYQFLIISHPRLNGK